MRTHLRFLLHSHPSSPPLYRWLCFAMAVALFGLGGALTAVQAASDANSGTLEGRVFDAGRGEYLNNARLIIEGTAIETFTNTEGFYRFSNISPGPVRVQVFFTGLPIRTEAVEVGPGQSVTRDITFAATSDKTGAAASGETIKMGEFVVATRREMDASAIAINEQRFAPNIKTVVSTDEFGDVAESNVAEFLKFMPGMSIELSGGDGRTVSIDGAPPNNVPIMFNGITLPNPIADNRGTEVGFFSLNNVARVEVSQSPTPDMPGSSLAGSINMVPRSAFDRSKPLFKWSTYLMMRDDARHFHQVPTQYRDPGYDVNPGFDISLIMPLNKQVGFTFSAGRSRQYSAQDRIALGWRGVTLPTNGAAFPNTTPDRPYLTSYRLQDSPKETTRQSMGFTLDFKLAENDRLSLSLQYSAFDGQTSARGLLFEPLQVVAATLSPTNVQGVAGRGRVQQLITNNRIREDRSFMPSLSWRHRGPIWQMEAGVGRSIATDAFRDADKGMFVNVTTVRNNVTVNFSDVGALRPGAIAVLDTTGAQVDPFRLDSYALSSVAAGLGQRYEDLNVTAFANARRTFSWRVPLTLKAGLDFGQYRRDIEAGNVTYTYLGPNGNGSTTLGSGVPFLNSYLTRPMPLGFPVAQWIDSKGLYEYFKANPGQFSPNDLAAYNARVSASKYVRQAVSAAYLRGDAAFFHNRLQLVGGLRVEQTNIDAQGQLVDPTLNLKRDASGAILHDATGKTIPITSDPLETAKLTTLRRAARTEKEYLRLFPSLNASYNLKENLILRGAIYTSVGTPAVTQYASGINLPNTDLAPNRTNNFIQVSNVAIKPWTATTTKLRLEYYTQGVGQISVGVFRRDFKNFFGQTFLPATSEFLDHYGLDAAQYGNYEVQTQYNLSGTRRMEGMDVNYKQALTFLPNWARGVQVFANGSVRRMVTRKLGDEGFHDIPRSASWGISFTRPRYNVRMNWNYVDARNLGPITGVGIESETYQYVSSRCSLDIMGEYQVWKNISVFANLRNVNDVPDENIAYGPNTPNVARVVYNERYGSLWTLGLKGTF